MSYPETRKKPQAVERCTTHFACDCIQWKLNQQIMSPEEVTKLLYIAQDLHWMARRYADGCRSYATRFFNEHTRWLLAKGIPLNMAGDNTVWARDGMGRAYDGLTDEEAALGEEQHAEKA